MGNIENACAIVGMGCSKFGERWDTSFDDLIIEAAYEAYQDAGIDSKDIQAAWASFTTSSRTGESLARPLKLQYIPITHVENACASGMDAIRNACYAVTAGVYDVVMAIGVEKLKDSALSGLPRPGGIGYWHPVFDFGAAPPSDYALAANRYFYQYNLSHQEGKELLAKIAVKNHHNGSLSPKAHFQKEVTLEQVMKAPIISWPLGLFDCCPTTDGAAAAIITRADIARNFRDDYVLIKGLALSIGPGFGRWDTDYDFVHFEETERAAREAYWQAGIKNPRQEISLANIHDCFTISELILYESLGFCEKGRARVDVDAGTFTLDGELPVNTDGGLKSFGHPIGASGIRKIYEIYKQLQDKAGPRQLKNPVLGLAHNEGGIPGAFHCAVTILGVRD
jgi:acetyl-CoA C-acetyltransferase